MTHAEKQKSTILHLKSAGDAHACGWYLEAGIGAAAADNMQLEGWNTDQVCYPTFSECPPPQGYNWIYDASADVGAVLSAALGYEWSQLRTELTLVFRERNMEQTFSSIAYLGTTAPLLSGPSDYSVTVFDGVGVLVTRSVLTSAYYRLPVRIGPTNPLVGALVSH